MNQHRGRVYTKDNEKLRSGQLLSGRLTLSFLQMSAHMFQSSAVSEEPLKAVFDPCRFLRRSSLASRHTRVRGGLSLHPPPCAGA